MASRPLLRPMISAERYRPPFDFSGRRYKITLCIMVNLDSIDPSVYCCSHRQCPRNRLVGNTQCFYVKQYLPLWSFLFTSLGYDLSCIEYQFLLLHERGIPTRYNVKYNFDIYGHNVFFHDIGRGHGSDPEDLLDTSLICYFPTSSSGISTAFYDVIGPPINQNSEYVSFVLAQLDV